MDSEVAYHSFKELFEKYLKSFHDQSFEEVKSHFSQHIELWVRGKHVLQAPEQLDLIQKNYEDHWSLPNCRVTVESLEEWWDADKKEGGVLTKIIDWPRAKLVDIKYTYTLEGDKWVQRRHDINEVVDYDVNSGSRPSES
jgi:hypothetical protein